MQHLASFFPELLRKASSDPEVVLIFLRRLWPQLAGAELARKCMVQDFKGKTLIIRVLDPVWERELGSVELQEILRSRINSFWRQRLIERIALWQHPRGMSG